ncbi:MAG: tetratricopeptide repeat protein [Acidimicrobiia bacterium]
MAILATVTLLTIIAGFLGVREARNIRATREEMAGVIEETKSLRDKLENDLSSLTRDFETLVQVAHLFHEGQQAYGEGNFPKAIGYFNDALEYQPDNHRILARLGRCYTSLGNLSRAEHYLTRALRANPEDPAILRALAANARYVDPPKALDLIQRAIDSDPSDPESWSYFGLLLRDLDDYQESLVAVEESCRLNPSDPIAQYFRALLEERLGHRDTAALILVEACSNLDLLERSHRIKPIWANALRWAHSVVVSLDDGVEIARDIVKQATEPRTALAVVGHMAFLLGPSVVDSGGQLHPSLACFELNLVREYASLIAEQRSVEASLLNQCEQIANGSK